MAPHRRKNLIASRRRVEDEGEEEGGPDLADVDDDSLSDGSLGSDDDDAAADGSDVSHGGLESPEHAKAAPDGRGPAAQGDTNDEVEIDASSSQKPMNGTSDTDIMLNGLQITDDVGEGDQVNYEDMQRDLEVTEVTEPAMEVSKAQMDQAQEAPFERRRREHEEYKKKRDADPAFVPNRGAFFMHDHRHAGPAANGFRPFGRGRGRGRGGMGGPFAPSGHMHYAPEPTDAPWTHDMHETVAERDSSITRNSNSGYNNSMHDSSRSIPQAPKTAPINRSLSTTKHVGNIQIRVCLDSSKKPTIFPGVAVKHYTRLPDHRPPLRRDKPVRISLPDHPPKYIFPAVDRSFIFIPRAMRPNQQGFGGRSRARSGLGSVGGYSRRTSIFGGSAYGGTYTPSVAMSRCSSLAHEIPRDHIISPTGSTMSRPAMTLDNSRPVVRLPPSQQQAVSMPPTYAPGSDMQNDTMLLQPDTSRSSSDDVSRPPPQQMTTYPMPQKPTYRENRPSNTIPMHQPRPQKAVSVADIESPASMSLNNQPSSQLQLHQQQQQPFHQQVPVQVNGHNGIPHDHLLPYPHPHPHSHSRQPSYPSQPSTGTPLSQIPERAIHAQPFQPNAYQQAAAYYPQPYQMMPPMQPQQQPGYYYHPSSAYNPVVAMGPSVGGAAPPFVPAQPPVAAPAQAPENTAAATGGGGGGGGGGGQPNLVAQEVNGMVYYYDASQIPAVAAAFSGYAGGPVTAHQYQQQQQQQVAYAVQQQQQVGGIVGLGGMMTPSPDGFYYPQPGHQQGGVVYYPQ